MATDKRNVALIGMMGSGKSTVGAELARRLGWTFYDTDLLLEAAFEKPVRRIFQAPGEPAFRAAEGLLVRVLMSLDEAVLATGGGLWMAEHTRRLLSSFAYTVYLAASPGVLWRRLGPEGADLRPLLGRGDPREALERLAASREVVYGLADCRVDASGSDAKVLADQILRKLRSAGLIARPEVAA